MPFFPSKYKFVDSLATTMKETLKNGHFFIFHRLVRFLSDLINVRVVNSKSVLHMYQLFIELTNDPDSPQVIE